MSGQFLTHRLRHIIPVIILMYAGAYVAYAQTFELPAVNQLPASQSVPQFNSNPLGQPLTLVATPSSPSPGESVTVVAQTPSLDKERTDFVWTIDSVRRPDISGLGKNTFTFIAKEVGSATRVSMRIEPAGDLPMTSSLVVYSTDIAITWTANTYVPKWYKGKALPIPNSAMHIAAIPTFIIEGKTLLPDRLIYTWNKDGNRILKGIGKRTLQFQMPEQSWDTPTILLVIEDDLRRIKKEVRVTLVGQTPKAVIYQTLPLGGVEFRRGTSAFPSVAPSIVDLQVEPFFFNQTSKYDLSYKWSIQHIMASSSPQNPFILTLDMREQQPSDIPISVFIKDPDMFGPSATKFLSIPIRQ